MLLIQNGKQERVNNMSIGKNITVKYEDNSKYIQKEFKAKKTKILYAMGLKWLEICTKIITRNGIVDTGRLRASLSFITPKDNAGNGGFKGGDKISGRAEEDNLIVGSNVKYAAKQELTNKKGSFIRPSVLDYKEDYKNIAETILKE